MWPGATAQEMQDLVAEPLEKRMQELRWYDRVETFTRPGVAVMMVYSERQDPGLGRLPEEFYQARKKLGDEAPRLPAGVQGPFVNDEYSDVDFRRLRARGSWDAAARADARSRDATPAPACMYPGVKKVNIQGERPERIFVDFSYARLANSRRRPGGHFRARSSARTP